MKIRKALPKDSKEILRWRNDIKSRNMFIESYVVSEQTHNEWFTNALKDSSSFLYIGEINKNKIGIVRFNCDFKKSICLVSININPRMRGLGLSFDLLSLSIKKIPDFKNLEFHATIKKDNIKSKKIFRKCGFTFEYSLNGFDYFTLKNL